MYEQILNCKLKKNDYSFRKSIRKFGMKAGYQNVLEKIITKEINKSNNINTFSRWRFSKTFSKTFSKPSINSDMNKSSNNSTRSILKSMERSNKFRENYSKFEIRAKPSIKGIRPDGFDIYRPTKMMQKKNWRNFTKSKVKVQGVLLKDLESKSKEKNKTKLFYDVFLRQKEQELQALRKKEKQVISNPHLILKSNTNKKAKKHNSKLFKEFTKPLIIQQYGTAFFF